MITREAMWEVNVPIHDPADHRTGVHVFTGMASDKNAALAAARRVVDEALESLRAGREIPVPHRVRLDWGARGLRPGWELRWERAQTRQIIP
ncbi:hypothetical protein [Streptomyces sp. NPDC004230]